MWWDGWVHWESLSLGAFGIEEVGKGIRIRIGNESVWIESSSWDWDLEWWKGRGGIEQDGVRVQKERITYSWIPDQELNPGLEGQE